MIKPSLRGTKTPIATKPPAHFGPIAAEIWKTTLKSVKNAGFQIDELDRQCFEAFCSASATIRECDAIIARDGLVVDGGREGLKRHPAAAVKNAALAQLRAYASALGLTASSRAKLPEDYQPEEPNEFDEFDEF